MKNIIISILWAGLILPVLFSCKQEEHDPYEQSEIHYRISFENRGHHEARVEAIFRNLPPRLPLEIVMSRSAPGRYALHEFTRNIYQIRITDRDGADLTSDMPAVNRWIIPSPPKEVHFEYTLYGNTIDGTHGSISTDHVLLNMPAVFVWARQLEKTPVTLELVKPEPSWQAATQLTYDESCGFYRANGRDAFLDAPVLLGPLTLRTFELESRGRTTRFTYALFHRGNERDVDEFASNIPLILREQQALFGELPLFEHDRYTFLHIYNPRAQVDGMEHRNSSVLTQYNPLSTHKNRFLVGTSHEFFHAWNVSRLKPRGLEAFNYEDQNMIEQLWFIEGTAVYYDSLLILRAGLINFDTFAEQLALHLDRVMRSPYKNYLSPIEISRRAVLLDGAVYTDNSNNGNIYLSHYDVGDILMMSLDLTLRTRFPGTSLDDYLRRLWEQYGRTEEPYTYDDLVRTLGELTGDSAFGADFFTRYVAGHEQPDYNKLLGYAGIHIKRKYKNAPSLGDVLLASTGSSCRLISNTPIGSPLYNAGLDQEDEIISLAGKKSPTVSRLYRIAGALKTGTTVDIVYNRGGMLVKTKLTIGADEEWETVTYEKMGYPVTREIAAFRAAWTGSKVQPAAP